MVRVAPREGRRLITFGFSHREVTVWDPIAGRILADLYPVQGGHWVAKSAAQPGPLQDRALTLLWVGAAILGALTATVSAGCAATGHGAGSGFTPSGEVLANHLSHAVVRCGTQTGVTLPPPGPGVPSAPVLIRHQHRMGGSYRLLSLRYVLNGATLCHLGADQGRVLESGQHSVSVLRGRLPLGDDRIRQTARYRGHGLGVFAYLRGYRYRVAGDGRFTVRENQPLCVDVIAFEKKGAMVSLKERPRVRLRLVPNCAAAASGTPPPVILPAPAAARK